MRLHNASALVMEDNVQDLKPLPSRFKGPSLPVEQVMERCAGVLCPTYLFGKARPTPE